MKLIYLARYQFLCLGAIMPVKEYSLKSCSQ